ncbi:MAG TPA: hypothetical protein VNJ71_04010 [Gemmatimonadales bacterium]|jgi:hypothetical protein|nr:hypothetical protein [Gemmatimonadales bacterium]
MMPTCREITRLLASDDLQTAPLATRILTRLHLLLCDDCSRYARELADLAEVLRESLRVPLDPVRLAALERAILERRGAGGGTS